MKHILMGLAVFAVIFLIGAFIEVSLDIRQWPESTRAFVGLMGLICAAVYAGAAYAIDSDKK